MKKEDFKKHNKIMKEFFEGDFEYIWENVCGFKNSWVKTKTPTFSHKKDYVLDTEVAEFEMALIEGKIVQKFVNGCWCDINARDLEGSICYRREYSGNNDFRIIEPPRFKVGDIVTSIYQKSFGNRKVEKSPTFERYYDDDCWIISFDDIYFSENDLVKVEPQKFNIGDWVSRSCSDQTIHQDENWNQIIDILDQGYVTIQLYSGAYCTYNTNLLKKVQSPLFKRGDIIVPCCAPSVTKHYVVINECLDGTINAEGKNYKIANLKIQDFVLWKPCVNDYVFITKNNKKTLEKFKKQNENGIYVDSSISGTILYTPDSFMEPWFPKKDDWVWVYNTEGHIPDLKKFNCFREDTFITNGSGNYKFIKPFIGHLPIDDKG